MDSTSPAPTAVRAGRPTALYWTSVACVAALIGVPAWMLVANPAVLGGHPLLPGLLIAAAVAGVFWAVPLWRRCGQPRPRTRPRAVGAWSGRIAVLALVAALAWLNPFTYQPGAAAEAGPRSDLIVTETNTTITMTPDGGPAPTKGLVFYPGARVEARAYQDVLAPAVGAGYRVVILKEPLGLSLLDANQARSAMADNPDITTWAVGGHSLGGVAASSFAEDNTDVSGLVLYASYPLDSLRGRNGLAVLSVSGTKDGLSTPAKIDASADLPANAEFTAVQGGVHAFFGDYGAQPGDGEPGISREAAQEQIAAATVTFLDRLQRG